MARPRTFDPNDVLRIAVNLFWEKGYFDSSVDEVVRLSGVAKYGIYSVFGSKRELFRKVLQQYASDRHRDIQAPIRKSGAALPEIRHFFKQAVKLITREEHRHGCLMVNTGIELGLRDKEFHDVVSDFFAETEAVMLRCLNRAVKLGQIDEKEDLNALASFLVTEFRTALMLARSGCSRKTIQTQLNTALQILN